MPITADTKDWTWVLERPCPECGFDTTRVSRHEIPQLIRHNASAWPPLLTAGPDVRARPTDDRWSVLEYACHVRDVFTLFDHRLHRMLDEDDPIYPNWDQDATAIDERYNDQDPTVVAVQLWEAAVALAESFDEVAPDGWNRMGTRGDGARFSVETFARYLIHDPVHHLHDVTEANPRR